MKIENDIDVNNEGHGHVYPRADGAKARCGGPGLCHKCQVDQHNKEINKVLADLPNQKVSEKPHFKLTAEIILQSGSMMQAQSDFQKWMAHWFNTGHNQGLSSIPTEFMTLKIERTDNAS